MKKLKKDNFIQHRKYNTKNATQKIQHACTTRKLQHVKYSTKGAMPGNQNA